MTTPGFIHLHLHSAYSLLEGALPVKALAKLAAADGQPALAITDRNNLFGALEFSESLAAEGIQPIVGCALNVAFPVAAEETLPARRVRAPVIMAPSSCSPRMRPATAISCGFRARPFSIMAIMARRM